MQCNSGHFRFDGGAPTHLGIGRLGLLITVYPLGAGDPRLLTPAAASGLTNR
ncbi:MAG: hypothetical protein ABI807_15210 [Sporichthyaceae bacterium]